MPTSTPTPTIALLTDFGHTDGYVGIMKGVILSITTNVHLVDITHDIPPQDVQEGAFVLHTAWNYFPENTVFLCVIDPGVGTARLPIAVRVAGRTFVGPDNGLLSYVVAASPVEAAIDLDDARYRLPVVSATFHGRDIFAPCAAWLASGVPLASMGTPVDPDTLISLLPSAPEFLGESSTYIGHVIHVDRYGNLITDIAADARSVDVYITGVHVGGHYVMAHGQTFADGPPGKPFYLPDSSGYLAIAVRNGSATALLGVGRGAEVMVDSIIET